MHRQIEIKVPGDRADAVIQELRKIDGVTTISHQPGHAVKPNGDVIGVTVLNTGADAVLHAALREAAGRPVSVATSTADSVVDTDHAEKLRGDHDEALWEEAETAMRRHTRPNLNVVLTAAAGGLVAIAGLTASSVTEATALVAAAIIAPVFEPLARLGLGAINRHRRAITGALTSAALIYVVVVAAAVVTMLMLRAAGPTYLKEFLHSSTVHEVEHPPLLNLLLSVGGAVAGAVMVAAGRFTVLAGPVIALQLIPALATVGAGLELGDGTMAARAMGRLGIDIGMVLVAVGIVFLYKHLTVHQARRAAH